MSEREGDGLSPEELARRLEAPGRENEQMRSENAGPRGGAGSKFGGHISRRVFLGGAGAAAVSALAGGTLLDQHAALAAQAADLKRFYAGIKSTTDVEYEFGGMNAGILTPEELLEEQRAARKYSASAEPGVRSVWSSLLDVVFGIDVSHWQGDLDWRRIWKEGFRFSGIKATEGPYPNGQKYTDPSYTRNAERAKARGFVRFPYHFLVNAPVRRQVGHFLRVAGGGWQQGKCPMIDFEAYPNYPSLSPKKDHLFAFIRELRSRIGREPLIFVYSGKGYTDSLGGTDLRGFDNVHLWDASYFLGFKRGYAYSLWREIINDGYRPFARNRWSHRRKKISQFTSTAKVAGKLMDANAWRGDVHDLRRATGWREA
jgi:GH25 family lysozyme M1 (1,4-beta-N-acetylmuramidase)